MKLYFSPGTCSLAQHIVLTELNASYETIRVDMKTKTIPSGEDYNKINPKSQVPALQVSSNVFLTENALCFHDLELAWHAQSGFDQMANPDGLYGKNESLAFRAKSHESRRTFVRFKY
jgi:hypothetical protein